MNAAPSMAAMGKTLAKNGLEVSGLGIGHCEARDDAPLFRLSSHSRDADPSDEANDAIGNLDSNSGTIEARNYLRFSQGRGNFAHVIGSVSAERPNPVMHSCLSNFGEALRSFNPRVFVSEAIRLTDLFKIDSDATAVST